MQCSKCGDELRAYFKLSGYKIFKVKEDGSLGLLYNENTELEYKYLTCNCTPCPYVASNTLGTHFHKTNNQYYQTNQKMRKNNEQRKTKD